MLVKAWQDDKLGNILPSASFLGAMLAFFYYNKYPSKVFEGNIGSMFFGSVIGVSIVILEYWWFGFFILLPHILNYLLWMFWLYLRKSFPPNWNPDKYFKPSGKHIKFGYIRNDGTLFAPNFLTVKWIPNYFFRLTEPQSIICVYLFTVLFCILGFLIPI